MRGSAWITLFLAVAFAPAAIAYEVWRWSMVGPRPLEAPKEPETEADLSNVVPFRRRQG